MTAVLPAAGRPAIGAIQAARGAAAAAVVVFHAAAMMRLPQYGPRDIAIGVSEFGQYGVDLFFVISGFIMMHAHKRDIGRPDKLVAFFSKRFIRIYPIYWIYLTAYLALVFSGAGTRGFLYDGPNLVSSYLLVRLSPERLPLTVAWTLFHEILFYCVFAALIFRRKVGYVAFAAWIGLIGLFSVAVDATDLPPFFAVLLSPLNLEFMLGLAVYALPACSNRIANLCILSATAAAALTSYLVSRIDMAMLEHPILHVFIGFLGAVALYGLICKNAAATYRPSRGALALGDASYTIYLVHTPVISALLIGMRATPLDTALTTYLAYAGLIAAAVAAGLVLFFALERPLLKQLRAWALPARKHYAGQRVH